MDILEVISIISIIIAPLVAVLITLWLEQIIAHRKEQLDIFKILNAYKDFEINFTTIKAYNMVQIAFAKRTKVIARLNENQKNMNKKAKLLLLQEMANTLDFKSKITWDVMFDEFIPDSLKDEMANVEMITKGQIEMYRTYPELKEILQKSIEYQTLLFEKSVQTQINISNLYTQFMKSIPGIDDEVDGSAENDDQKEEENKYTK